MKIILKTPAINIGSRQHHRIKSRCILNTDISKITSKEINQVVKNYKPIKQGLFGNGDSNIKFVIKILSKKFWNVSHQKYFIDNKYLKYKKLIIILYK